MSNPIKVLAVFLAKPGKTEELKTLLVGVAEATQRDRGVILYQLHQDKKEPRRFVFFESWASQEDIDLHDATPHITDLVAQLPHLTEQGAVDQLTQLV